MENISKIKTALEFLKDNDGFNVGSLFLSCRDQNVFVYRNTNYRYIENLNKKIATKELEEIKIEFNNYIDVVPEFKDFLKDKEISYHLTYNYGMGSFEICNETKEIITWAYNVPN